MAQASPDNIAPLKTLAFSPDGRLLAGVGTGGLVVWDVPLRTPSFLASDTRLTAAAFTPDGRWLLAGGHTTEIQAWRTDCWQMHPWLDWQVGWIDALAVSPDGTTAAAAGWNGQIVVWDLDL